MHDPSDEAAEELNITIGINMSEVSMRNTLLVTTLKQVDTNYPYILKHNIFCSLCHTPLTC